MRCNTAANINKFQLFEKISKSIYVDALYNKDVKLKEDKRIAQSFFKNVAEHQYKICVCDFTHARTHTHTLYLHIHNKISMYNIQFW